MRSALLRATVSLTCLVAWPMVALAQSTIAGSVRDVSGGVLPGVTVEAASVVLIEKARTVTTDQSGSYRIADLRPGVYSVTFTLTGFTTFRRESLALPAEFTAPVNAEMKGQLPDQRQHGGPLRRRRHGEPDSTRGRQPVQRELQDPVPSERQIRGLGPIVMSVPTLEPTETLLTQVLNMRPVREYPHPGDFDTHVQVFEMGRGGPHAELHLAVQPHLPQARQGAGAVHHVAFRTPDADDDARA